MQGPFCEVLTTLRVVPCLLAGTIFGGRGHPARCLKRDCAALTRRSFLPSSSLLCWQPVRLFSANSDQLSQRLLANSQGISNALQMLRIAEDKGDTQLAADLRGLLQQFQQERQHLESRAMQLEAQTGGKISVEHQLNASSELPALERYCAIGKSLREEPEVKSLTKFLRDLDKQAMFCYGSIHFPFLFVEASSGIGKSQLPYALTLPTVHLFTSQLQGQQPLYSNLNPLCKIFCDALLADARVLQAMVRATGKPGAPGYVGTWEDLQNCKSAFVNLQTCGLLSALVDRTLELGNPVTNPDYFRDLYGAAYTLQYTSMTPEELLQRMTSLRVEKKPLPVIFLDETPPHQCADATLLAPLARNLLRYVTLIEVMMGTNSSILNFHTWS
ncbi:hypothetical protein QOT17_024338 [Balamuthia mandrillaris]